jgi:hypothetical protein
MTQRVVLDLQVLPYGEWDGRAQDGDLPEKPMYSGLDNPSKVLQAATCGWVRNATVSPTGGCPVEVEQMCKLDYSTWDNVRRSYIAMDVTEVGFRAWLP